MAYSCGIWLKHVGDSLGMWEMAYIWEKRFKYVRNCLDEWETA